MLKLPSNVVHVNHPLLQHKLSLMRDKKTRSVIFRALMKEAGMILGVEATKELKSYEKKILTPLEEMEACFLREPEPAVVSILRAGNGLLEGLLQIMPHAAVGFLVFTISIWISDIIRFSIGGNHFIGQEFWSSEIIVPAVLFGINFFFYILRF